LLNDPFNLEHRDFEIDEKEILRWDVLLSTGCTFGEFFWSRRKGPEILEKYVDVLKD